MLLSILAIAARSDCVVLLHGLARTSAAMDELASGFATNGCTVANID